MSADLAEVCSFSFRASGLRMRGQEEMRDGGRAGRPQGPPSETAGAPSHRRQGERDESYARGERGAVSCTTYTRTHFIARAVWTNEVGRKEGEAEEAEEGGSTTEKVRDAGSQGLQRERKLARHTRTCSIQQKKKEARAHQRHTHSFPPPPSLTCTCVVTIPPPPPSTRARAVVHTCRAQAKAPHVLRVSATTRWIAPLCSCITYHDATHPNKPNNNNEKEGERSAAGALSHTTDRGYPDKQNRRRRTGRGARAASRRPRAQSRALREGEEGKLPFPSPLPLLPRPTRRVACRTTALVWQPCGSSP